MAENDIYNSQQKYNRFVKNYKTLLTTNSDGPDLRFGPRRYFCLNIGNLIYFEQLFKHFDFKDLSYLRRIRVLQSFKIICHYAKRDLKLLEREEINDIVAAAQQQFNAKTKCDFIRDLKCTWRILFPEKDQRDRIDETLTPYSVRHLSARVDKSKEKRRQDRLTLDELEKLITYFGNNPCIQASIALAIESLGRPQEILYRKHEDAEIYADYAKIWVSDHGKEGANGFLQCVDSFPYFMRWINSHPQKSDPHAYILVFTPPLCGDWGKYNKA